MGEFKDLLREYLGDLPGYTTEQSIAQRFLGFLREGFRGATVGKARDLYPELEQHVSDKTIAVKGRVDAILGNLMVEFKRDLKRSLPEAEEQLRRYAAALWNARGTRVPYVLVASDGRTLRIYLPRTPIPAGEPVRLDDVYLDPLDELNLGETPPDFAYMWLDRYVITLPDRAKPLLSEDFIRDFGRDSPVYKAASRLLAEAMGQTPSLSVVYDEWDRYLSYVYGSSVASEELFIRHTYTALLARLMLFTWYSGGALPSPDQTLAVVQGRAFVDLEIKNFLEEDFFTWPSRGPRGTVAEVARVILEPLKTYDLSEVKQDVLKGIYQDLVDPAERHDLGEYYTPDWLADMMLKVTLVDPGKRVLDPACGSGTFLMAGIRRMREICNLSAPALLQQILNNISGMDVHPLAVMVSRANYLLAIGDLVRFRKGAIHVPVYLANSLFFDRPRQDIHLGNGAPCYIIEEAPKMEGSDLQGLLVPESLVDKPERLDRAIDITGEFAETHGDRKMNRSDLADYFSNRSFQVSSAELDALYETARAMALLISQNKNSIWAFILKNIYRPAYLRKKPFDIVIGNPPWISFRYLRNPDYQARVKDLIQNSYKMAMDAHLVTQMDMSGLFFARASDLYLRNRGTIAFVMPKSVFTADQYAVFRTGIFGDYSLRYTEAWDMEDVSPLFNISACVVIAKKGSATRLPILGKIISGELPRKDMGLATAEAHLDIKETKFKKIFLGKRDAWGTGGSSKPRQGSIYKKLFRNGATLYPRTLLMVVLAPHPKLGMNPDKPLLKTDPRVDAKPPWSFYRMSGAVEKNFLYASLLSTDLVPFGWIRLRLLVLPFLMREGKFVPMTAEEMKLKGFPGAGEWFARCEEIWDNNKTDRCKEKNITLYQWINYRNKVTQQNPGTKWRVLYGSSGTHLAACVLNGTGKHETISGELPILADFKTYYYEVDEETEANYLAAVLNSRLINEAIKPFQSRGLFGARDICSKPLEIPIPKFDPGNKTHQRLAEIGRACAERVAALVPDLLEKHPGSSANAAGRRRTAIRELLSDELAEIDRLVIKLLE